MLDGDAEFFGVGLEVLVVVAALAAGVLDAAGGGQGVRGFVQQGAEDGGGAAFEPFAADHDFGAVFEADAPALRGVVAPAGLLAVGAAGDDDDDGRDLGLAGADGLPGGFQDRAARR